MLIRQTRVGPLEKSKTMAPQDSTNSEEVYCCVGKLLSAIVEVVIWSSRKKMEATGENARSFVLAIAA
jgi:hypothetical protein